MKKIVIIISLLLGIKEFKAQSLVDNTEAPKSKLVFGVSCRTGILTYYGELNKQALPFSSSIYLNYGGSLNFKRGYVSLDLNFDKIKFGQFNSKTVNHQNFYAEGNMYGVDINFYPISYKNFGLYIGSGLSFLNYKTYTDTLDKNGNAYNYWSNGQVKTIAENNINSSSAIRIKRDYKYETFLKKYQITAIPIKLGFMFRFVRDLNINVVSTYYLTNKQGLDGFSGSSKTNFMYNSISLTWFFNSYDDATRHHVLYLNIFQPKKLNKYKYPKIKAKERSITKPNVPISDTLHKIEWDDLKH